MDNISDEDFEARQRLFSVKEQIDSPHAGKFDMYCPYCDGLTAPGKEFCCKLMRDAVITILMVRRQMNIEANKYGLN